MLTATAGNGAFNPRASVPTSTPSSLLPSAAAAVAAQSGMQQRFSTQTGTRIFHHAPFHSSSRICSFIPLFNPLTAVLRPSSAGSRPWGLRAGSPLVRTLQVCVIMPSVARSCICLIFCFPLSGRRIFCNIRFSSHRNGSHPRKGSLAGSAIVNVTFCTRAIVKYKRPLYHPAMPGFRF